VRYLTSPSPPVGSQSVRMGHHVLLEASVTATSPAKSSPEEVTALISMQQVLRAMAAEARSQTPLKVTVKTSLLPPVSLSLIVPSLTSVVLVPSASERGSLQVTELQLHWK
jgi:hypothetical protein